MKLGKKRGLKPSKNANTESEQNLSCFFNPFVSNAPFLYPLKTWCFPGVEKGCIGNEWVKNCIQIELWKSHFPETESIPSTGA